MDGELKAKCRLGCSKVIPRNNGNTISMKYHLEKLHKGLYSEYFNAIGKNKVSQIDKMSMEERKALYQKLDRTKPAHSPNRYFEYIPEEQKAKCRLGCPKLLQRKRGNTSSMMGHLKGLHKPLFQEYSNAIENLSKPKKEGQQVESTG